MIHGCSDHINSQVILLNTPNFPCQRLHTTTELGWILKITLGEHEIWNVWTCSSSSDVSNSATPATPSSFCGWCVHHRFSRRGGIDGLLSPFIRWRCSGESGHRRSLPHYLCLLSHLSLMLLLMTWTFKKQWCWGHRVVDLSIKSSFSSFGLLNIQSFDPESYV